MLPVHNVLFWTLSNHLAFEYWSAELGAVLLRFLLKVDATHFF